MEEWKFFYKIKPFNLMENESNQPTDLGNAIAILRGTDPMIKEFL